MKLLRIFVICALYAICLQNAFAWSVFGPSDFEDCAKKSATDAKSKEALNVLLTQCAAEFPARRSPMGGYVYFDVELMQSIPVSGPKLSSADVNKINQLKDANRKVAAEANARRNQRNMEARAKTQISSWKISCANAYYCGEKIITAIIKNDSNYTISGIGVGVVVNRKVDSCGQLSETSFKSVTISPNRSATLNFQTWDGPSDGAYQACLQITSVTTD